MKAYCDATDSIDGVTTFHFIELISVYKEKRTNIIVPIAILFSAVSCASQCKLRRLRANEAVQHDMFQPEKGIG